MKCPKCQFENHEKIKFCEELGSKLEQSCPECGAKIPLERKFCGECGHSFAIGNMTGQPAMSVPLFWNNENLPIGVHFMGRYGDEATLFRLASQLERAKPWTEKRPLAAGRGSNETRVS
jgi:hypothetical protein